MQQLVLGYEPLVSAQKGFVVLKAHVLVCFHSRDVLNQLPGCAPGLPMQTFTISDSVNVLSHS